MKLFYSLILMLSFTAYNNAMVDPNFNFPVANIEENATTQNVIYPVELYREDNDFQQIWIKENLYREIEEIDSIDSERLQDSEYIVLLSVNNQRYKRIAVCKDTYRSLLDYKNSSSDTYNKAIEVDWKKFSLIKNDYNSFELVDFIRYRLGWAKDNSDKVTKEFKDGVKEVGQEAFEIGKEAGNIAKEFSCKAGSKVKELGRDSADYTGDLIRRTVQPTTSVLRQDVETVINRVEPTVQRLEESVNNIADRIDRSAENHRQQTVPAITKDITNNGIKFVTACAGIGIVSWLAIKYINHKFKEKNLK